MYIIGPDGQVGQDISRMHLEESRNIVFISPDGSTLTLKFDTQEHAMNVLDVLHALIIKDEKCYDCRKGGGLAGLIGSSSTTSH